MMATWTEYTLSKPRRVVEGLLGFFDSWKRKFCASSGETNRAYYEKNSPYG
jgi:hypothetical protein